MIRNLIFKNEDVTNHIEYQDTTFHEILGNGVVLLVGSMYKFPELSKTDIEEIKNHFDARYIDIDKYQRKGCEKCDYGSDYGYVMTIYGPKKNLEEIEELKKII